MTKREAVTGIVRRVARLPDHVPETKVWAIALSVVVGGVVALVGVGILYAGLRVYVETKGGAVSLPLLGGGLVTFGWGANHISSQFAKGTLAHSLGALAAPIRRLKRAAKDDAPEEPTDG